jgi:type II secretory pathway predicted ATPase ExeA
MYESYFRLSHRPFAAAPRADAYIPTGSLEHSRQTLVRCIDRAEGPGLVVGPAGTGKSLLCQILAKHFGGRFQVAHLAGARLSTRRALLQNILFELKLPYRDMDEGELRLSLIDHLEPRSGGTEGLLLIVDEAHMLPLRLLEEIRLLTNVVRDGQARVRLVLAGGMALEERLTTPKLESFHQRLAARCYLQPLGRDETIYYVQEQIRRCGASADDLLRADAQAAVHTASDGIPRLINQICDHALMLAALGGHSQLGVAGIEEAWADLQQLPLPLHEPPVLVGAAGGKPGSTIEFGQLADEEPIVAGTIGPNLADAAVANLDAISRTLDTLSASPATMGVVTGTAADDFSPSAASGTEVELYFHSAHDPFGGQWEEEEVVIDRYALLEDAALRRRRVTSEDGRAMGAAISAAAGMAVDDPRAAVVDRGPGSADASAPGASPAKDDAPATIAASADFNPASDPLMPEEASPPVRPRRGPVSLRALAQDDRDMIVIDDDPAASPAPPIGQSRRSEYRQLFSTLRNK